MRLITPVEHRIQLIAVKHGDQELQRCAIDVRHMRDALHNERRRSSRLNVLCTCLSLILMIGALVVSYNSQPSIW
jgi:hypothetical protein